MSETQLPESAALRGSAQESHWGTQTAVPLDLGAHALAAPSLQSSRQLPIKVTVLQRPLQMCSHFGGAVHLALKALTCSAPGLARGALLPGASAHWWQSPSQFLSHVSRCPSQALKALTHLAVSLLVCSPPIPPVFQGCNHVAVITAYTISSSALGMMNMIFIL